MNGLGRGLNSSVGLKFVAALTGLVLVVFVIGHMLGNLQVFAGPEQLNAYAEHLQALGLFLWLARGGLLIVLVLHLYAVIRLQLVDWGARPVSYERRKPLKSNVASRTMIWSGLLLLSFVVYHLLHLTFGVTNPGDYGFKDSLGHHDVYKMVVLGFQRAPVTIAYVVAMILLGFHLYHGFQSIFQSMGWNHPKYKGFWTKFGKGLAIVLVLGNISMPLAILFHLIGLPGGGN